MGSRVGRPPQDWGQFADAVEQELKVDPASLVAGRRSLSQARLARLLARHGYFDLAVRVSQS